MDYIHNSVRKISDFFSSSPPVSTLGKRKAESDHDSNVSGLEQPRLKRQSLGPSLSKHVSASYKVYNYPVPQRPQTRKQKPTTPGVRSATTKSATSAPNKAGQALRDAQTVRGKLEQELQSELGQQHKEETIADSEKGHVLATAAQRRTIAPSHKKSNKEKWTSQPNRQARDVLGDNGRDIAGLLTSLKEPRYVCVDTEIGDSADDIMQQIQAFAEDNFNFAVSDRRLLRLALKSLSKETVKIIGCVASGGPAGAEGWKDLFLETDKRKALVCAIIGNVLSEQVLQHLFFGGTAAQIQAVADIQFQHKDEDGFDRSKLYALKIRSFLTTKPFQASSFLHLPPAFLTHVNHTVAALYTHLKPLLSLHHTPPLNPSPIPASHQSTQDLHRTFLALHTLVVTTALMSLHMRLDPHTAYHITPVFKDQPFTKASMTCVNHAAMIATHPLGNGREDGICKAERERRLTLPAEEKERMKGDVGLVQICIFPGLTAWRRGGWEELVSDKGSRVRGVRERRLAPAWVYCRWGRKRVWVDGKPADEPKVHGVIWKGGFVGFFPGVEGVRDPRPDRTRK